MQTIYTSRSPYGTSLNCGRAGYWNSHYAGKGIQPAKQKGYYITGKALHLACQMIMTGSAWVDVEEAIDGLWDAVINVSTHEDDHPDHVYYIKEQRLLSKALGLVWLKERYPSWKAEYRVLTVEPEIRTRLYQTEEFEVILQSRPDIIQERLSDGAIGQWELKSKANLNANYIKSWEHNQQLIAQQLAVHQWARDNNLGDRLVIGAMVEVLLKGARKRDKGGFPKQDSPLIYVYAKAGDGIIPVVWQTAWKRDWPRVLVSEVAPIQQFIMELDSEITAPKAACIPLLAPSEYEIAEAAEQWGLAVIADHQNITCMEEFAPYENDNTNYWLNKFFRKNTDYCYQKGPCQFLSACWDTTVNRDPLNGGYMLREENHPLPVDGEE